MTKMIKDMMKKAKDQKGATMVEYALMVALVAIALVTAVQAMTTGISGTFGQVVTGL